MKQLKAKLLAGVLSVAMVLGTFAGAAPLTAKAASHATELTVRAVDESGKALSGVELVFEKDGETYDFVTTDDSGEAYLDENDFTDLVMAKSVKTSTISKNTTVKKTVKKLSAKKTYYVRVRTYKNVKVGKKTVKLYSGWSKVKAVKTK